MTTPATGGTHTEARDWLEATVKRETADLGSPASRRNALTTIMGAADTYAARAAAHAVSAKPSAIIQLSEAELTDEDAARLLEQIQAALQNEPSRLLVDSDTAARLARRDERERCWQIVWEAGVRCAGTLTGRKLAEVAALLRQDQP